MRNVSRFGVVFLLYWLFMKSSCIYLPWLALEWLSRAFHLAFTRPPNASECAAARQFIETQSAARKGDGALALVDFCHALLNANELIYPD